MMNMGVGIGSIVLLILTSLNWTHNDIGGLRQTSVVRTITTIGAHPASQTRGVHHNALALESAR